MSNLKNFIRTLKSNFSKTPQQKEREDLEAYLSKAQSIYDLEHLQRQWDRMQQQGSKNFA